MMQTFLWQICDNFPCYRNIWEGRKEAWLVEQTWQSFLWISLNCKTFLTFALYKSLTFHISLALQTWTSLGIVVQKIKAIALDLHLCISFWAVVWVSATTLLMYLPAIVHKRWQRHSKYLFSWILVPVWFFGDVQTVNQQMEEVHYYFPAVQWWDKLCMQLWYTKIRFTASSYRTLNWVS